MIKKNLGYGILILVLASIFTAITIIVNVNVALIMFTISAGLTSLIVLAIKLIESSD